VRSLRSGQFASSNPRSILVAGAFGYRAADPDGVEVGVFGWADPTSGLVDNARTALNQVLGLVLPNSSLRRIPNHWGVIPPGYEVTLAKAGDFFVGFPNGATRGQRVYASTLDGTPFSGETPDSVPTPWFVIADAAPGELTVISSWSYQQ
jgi:hypothetical protein